jgi:hypothetical protein
MSFNINFWSISKLLIIKKEKMKTEKLSFDAFKKMADNVQSEEVLQKIEGGMMKPECHGWWGTFCKMLYASDLSN